MLRPGEVQRMSAGTGILHSEINSSDHEVANTLQLWFMPRDQDFLLKGRDQPE